MVAVVTCATSVEGSAALSRNRQAVEATSLARAWGMGIKTSGRGAKQESDVKLLDGQDSVNRSQLHGTADVFALMCSLMCSR